MTKTFKTALAGLFFLYGFSPAAYAEDKYGQLAKDITEAGSSIHGKKIAIIPFSYADGRTGATKDGSVISERLSIKMINMHKFEIIERSVLDKVMTELKLQSSGMIDASSAQQLGKVLGVEAIVTGTLVETSNGQIEINARLIKTETAQAIGASQATVEKDWIGDAATAPQQIYQQPVYQQQPYQQSAYQQPVTAPVYQRRQKGAYEYGYFDVFFGVGSPSLALEFSNTRTNIYLSQLYITGTLDGPYQSVSWNDLETAGFGPLALRAGRYGNNNLGGAVELGLEKRNIKTQKTSWSLNGVPAGDFNFNHEDYLTVTSFYVAGNLMVRFTKKTKAEPYAGLGLGLSLNAINMPYVKGLTNSSVLSAPTDDIGLGLVVNVPVGVRLNISEKAQLVAELRYQLNTITFDRNMTEEKDTLTVKGLYFNIGMGFNF